MSLVPDGSLTSTLLAWVLTYLIHSTVLWIAAHCVARGIRQPANEELLWRCVLLAGLFTASLQPIIGAEGWTLTSASGPPAPRTAVVLPSAGAPPMASDLSTAATSPDLTSAVAFSDAGAPAPAASQPWHHMAMLSARSIVPWALGLLALYFWLRPMVAWWRFDHRLSSRRELTEGPARRLLTDLLRQPGLCQSVTLSCSKKISVPFAFGLRRPEICLPERAVESLNEPELRSLLAHELAHIVRRDPHWRFLTAWLEDLLFFQPLNRVTGRRLARLAEFMSDDWSRRHTSPRSMAQCLASVAEWLPRAVPRTVAASPMSAKRSELVERIRRLAGGNPSSGISRPRMALGFCLLMASLPVVAAVPGFRVMPVEPPTPISTEPAIAPSLPPEAPKPVEPQISISAEPAIAPSLPPEAPKPVEPQISILAEPPSLPPEAPKPVEPRISISAEPAIEPSLPPEAPKPVEPRISISAELAIEPSLPPEAPKPVEPLISISTEPVIEPSSAPEACSALVHPDCIDTPAVSVTAKSTGESAATETSKTDPKSTVERIEAQCDTRPKLLFMRPPEFPERARTGLGKDSVIEAMLTIDELGTVIDVELTDANPVVGFGRSVQSALRSAAFEPCLQDGVPVIYQHSLQFIFKWSGGALNFRLAQPEASE